MHPSNLAVFCRIVLLEVDRTNLFSEQRAALHTAPAPGRLITTNWTVPASETGAVPREGDRIAARSTGIACGYLCIEP